MTKKYQPSNGTEGSWFEDKFCMQCKHCNPDPEGEKQCDILLRAFAFYPEDEEYPTEWTYNQEGEPVCTNHAPWNWNTQGNPDDPENPNYQMPYNPNQITIFDVIENRR